MDPDPHPTSTVDSPGASDGIGSNLLVNALIGAVAGVLLSFVPFSTVLGGAIAGYLEGGDAGDGVKVGALTGLIMFFPFVFVGLFVAFLLLGFGGAPAAFGVFFLFVLFAGAAYTIGFGVLGGFLGVYVKDQYDL